MSDKSKEKQEEMGRYARKRMEKLLIRSLLSRR